MKNESVSRSLRYCALVLVGSVVIWAFTLVGSPSFNRKLSADKNRVEDFRRLSYGVVQYFDEHKKLPSELRELERTKYWDSGYTRLEDPTSGKPYEFKVKDEDSYELCGEFELSAKEAEIERKPYHHYGGYQTNWNYEAGYHCFSFQIPEKSRN